MSSSGSSDTSTGSTTSSGGNTDSSSGGDVFRPATAGAGTAVSTQS